MIIYIHGFGSSGCGTKAKLFKEYFSKDILAPSLSYVPELAIDTLEQLIQFFKTDNINVNLIGSSLGGFYSLYLAHKYALKAVLINPALNAPTLLALGVGNGVNYHDNSKFEFNDRHLHSLKNYTVKDSLEYDNFLVFCKKGDEVVDYSCASQLFLGSENLILEEGGDHSFDDIEKHFEKIQYFFRRDYS